MAIFIPPPMPEHVDWHDVQDWDALNRGLHGVAGNVDRQLQSLFERPTIGIDPNGTSSSSSSSGGGGSGGSSGLVTLVPPDDSLFSWVNQGGATVTVTAGKGIYLNAPAGAGNNQRIRDMAAPSTPYTVTAAFVISQANVNFSACGLVFRDSASGKIATLDTVWDSTNGNRNVSCEKFTNPTTFSANYTRLVWTPAGAYLWLRIKDDGTNRISSFSNDGINFRQLHTIGRTDFLTANRVGFYAEANQTTADSACLLVSWQIT